MGITTDTYRQNIAFKPNIDIKTGSPTQYMLTPIAQVLHFCTEECACPCDHVSMTIKPIDAAAAAFLQSALLNTSLAGDRQCIIR